jgi:hypothetical protein
MMKFQALQSFLPCKKNQVEMVLRGDREEIRLETQEEICQSCDMGW